MRTCDEALARLMRTCQELPGQELFRYRTLRGELVSINSSDVSRYIHEATGGPFTAKDFRIWAGTVAAVEILSKSAAKGASDRRTLNADLAEVASRLGNTRAVCRKYYIHPLVISLFEAGDLPRAMDAVRTVPIPRGLRRFEALTLGLLEQEAVHNGDRG